MFQERYMRRIIALVGIATIGALCAYAYYAITQAQNLPGEQVSISVSGEGEIFAKPDIALFHFSVNARETLVVTAQTKSADAINAIFSYLKEQGVEEKDIKTIDYNLSPRYEYPEIVCNQWGQCPPQSGEPKLIGYEVSQTIQVKVRKTETAGTLISGVGELGATNMSGLSFTIDDEDALKATAREEAINDAKEKAEKLATELGVRLVRITGFYEDEGGYPITYGRGGADTMAFSVKEQSVAPEIPLGENKITSRVTITYKIR